MKFLTRILISVFVITAVLFSALYILIKYKGKAVIAGQLEEITKRKVTMGSFELAPPLNLKIKNLNIEGLARIENIFISPSIPNLVIGQLAFNHIRITNPEINIERQVHGLDGAASETKTTPVSKKTFKSLPGNIIVKNIAIDGGKILFSDHTVGPAGIRITVKDLNVNVSNLYSYPTTSISNFTLTGAIPWQEGMKDGKVLLEGWINSHKKDMEATLKIESIDGVYLYPYYSKWVDLEKARIERANLNFVSNIHGLNNNVTADCHLELTDIVRKELASGESEGKAARIADQVMDIFRTLNQGKIVLDFTIRTKMDRPQFGFGNIKMAVEEKIAKARNGKGLRIEGVLFLPAQLFLGTVKATTILSKAVINSAFEVGNEFKKAVEDTFKKEPQGKKN